MIALGRKVENHKADIALILLKAICHHIKDIWLLFVKCSHYDLATFE